MVAFYTSSVDTFRSGIVGDGFVLGVFMDQCFFLFVIHSGIIDSLRHLLGSSASFSSSVENFLKLKSMYAVITWRLPIQYILEC